MRFPHSVAFSGSRVVLALVWVIAALIPVAAGDIAGQITVTRKSTRKTVVPGGNYALRGVAQPVSAPAASPDGLSQVAVWLESETARPMEPVKVALVQRNRRFVPDLVMVPVGSTVIFPNDDPIFHNVFSLSKAREFDLGYYLANKTPAVKFERSGIVQVYCHLHPGMYAAIIVVPSRYYMRAAADGSFSWAGVPAGTWRLNAWHRTAGLFHRLIQVPEHGPVEVRLELPDKEAESSP